MRSTPIRRAVGNACPASGPVGSLVGQLAKLHWREGSRHRRWAREMHLCEGQASLRCRGRSPRSRFSCPAGVGSSKRHRCVLENVGGAVWQALLPLLKNYARIPVSGLIAQYNGTGPGDGTDRLLGTVREILSRKPDLARLHQLRICWAILRRVPGRGRRRHRRGPHSLPGRHVDGLEKAPRSLHRNARRPQFWKAHCAGLRQNDGLRDQGKWRRSECRRRPRHSALWAVIFGITAALHGEITFEDGRGSAPGSSLIASGTKTPSPSSRSACRPCG